MKQQAKIDNWTLQKFYNGDYVLVGQVKDHPNQASFRTDVQMTSKLVSLDFENKRAETLNTSYELLNERKDEN